MTYERVSARKWKFVAFYTPLYAEEAAKLKETLDRFDVGYLIVAIEDRGGWYKNTSYKAEFIIQMLQTTNQDVVYVDVDARLMRDPALFDSLDCEIAFHRLNCRFRGNELLGGTVFFKNCEKIKEMLKVWAEDCLDNYHVWEQEKLDKCVKKSDLNVYLLPVEYCAIFDHPSATGADVVLLHTQASRRLKRGE